MLTPREKSPLPEKKSSEEDRTHDAASSIKHDAASVSPTHCQRAIPAPAIDMILREEHARFRNERGYTDLISVLRTTEEQSLEMNSPRYICYSGFDKAFNSIRHASLWKILDATGFEPKVISILKGRYTNNLS